MTVKELKTILQSTPDDIDDHWYVRSIADVICTAAFDSNPMNIKGFGCAFLLTHQSFINERARGVKRWKPEREIIIWR